MSNSKDLERIKKLVNNQLTEGMWVTRMKSGEITVMSNDTVVAWMIIRHKRQASTYLTRNFINWNNHMPKPEESKFHNAVSVFVSHKTNASKIAFKNGYRIFADTLKSMGM